MKNKTIILLMLVGVLSACSEEFSETVEIGSLNPDALQNEAGVNFALTAAYSNLDGTTNVTTYWTATGDNWWMDVVSDDAHKGSTDGDQQALFLLETYDWTTANVYLTNKWRSLYSGVNRATTVIDLVGAIEGGAEEFKDQLAEARFLRGFFYFELQKMFGFVAYISEENFAAKEFNQPNTGDVWAQIEADFTYAKENLPEDQDDAGRVNLMVATAFLGKAQLFQNKWADALTNLNTVIDSGKYALLPEYVHNFSLPGENGSESVFAIQFDIAGVMSPNGNQGGTLNFGGPNGWCCGFYQPSQDLVNAFQTAADGLPLLDTYNQTDVVNDYNVNSEDPYTPHAGTLDPRLDYTVGRRDIDYNGWDPHPGKSWIRAGFDDISGPYSPKKNVYQKDDTANVGTGNWGQQHSGINYNLMRYADVLLMAAEAAVETGDVAIALTYVNMIRERAKSMTYVQNEAGDAPAADYNIEPYTAFSGQEMARKAVRFERRLEFGMEGHRLFDIRRWGNAVEIMNAYFSNEARVITNFGLKAKPYMEKHNLFPIPIDAIDQSGGVLTQNPNW